MDVILLATLASEAVYIHKFINRLTTGRLCPRLCQPDILYLMLVAMLMSTPLDLLLALLTGDD